MSQTKKKAPAKKKTPKTTATFTLQLHELSSALMLIAQQVGHLRKDVNELGKHAHTHPDAPVLGTLGEEAAWAKADETENPNG